MEVEVEGSNLNFEAEEEISKIFKNIQKDLGSGFRS